MNISKTTIASLLLWICIIGVLKFIVTDVIFRNAYLADVVLIDTAFYKKQGPDGYKKYEDSKYLHIHNPIFLYCKFESAELTSFTKKDSIQAINIHICYKNDTISLNEYIVTNKKTILNRNQEYGTKNDTDYMKFANFHEIAYIHDYTLHKNYGFLIANIKGLQGDEAVLKVQFRFKSGRVSEVNKGIFTIK